MKRTCILLSAVILSALALTGCARWTYDTARDHSTLAWHHRFAADVTCTEAQSRQYSTLRDEFHLLAMPPRIRWSVSFQVEQVLQGDLTNRCFRLVDARYRRSPFVSEGIFWHTNTTYRVAFDRITDGLVKGLVVLETNRAGISSAANSTR